jgi:hypothetical protein
MDRKRRALLSEVRYTVDVALAAALLGTGGRSTAGLEPLAVQPPKYFVITSAAFCGSTLPTTTIVVMSGR